MEEHQSEEICCFKYQDQCDLLKGILEHMTMTHKNFVKKDRDKDSDFALYDKDALLISELMTTLIVEGSKQLSFNLKTQVDIFREVIVGLMVGNSCNAGLADLEIIEAINEMNRDILQDFIGYCNDKLKRKLKD